VILIPPTWLDVAVAESRSSELTERLLSTYDGALRVIATYDREEYELHHTEPDVEVKYSQNDLDEIYDELMMQEFTMPVHEDLFSDMGDVRGQFRLFEEGTVAHFWPSEDRQGVFVAFDGSADPSVRTLLETISEFYS
jgi:hypothetical protein